MTCFLTYNLVTLTVDKKRTNFGLDKFWTDYRHNIFFKLTIAHCPWPNHGPPTAHPWLTLSPSTAHPWPTLSPLKDNIVMDNAWTNTGHEKFSLPSLWTKRGQTLDCTNFGQTMDINHFVIWPLPMGQSRPNYSPYMAHPWPTHGLPMAHPWPTLSPSTAHPWPTLSPLKDNIVMDNAWTNT